MAFDIDNKEFEERADFISEEDLISWTVDNDYFQNIQKKLTEKGAKLIVGPRGTGKTHQFRHAYYKCKSDESKPLAIYVSFGKYYHLEPLLYKATNAINIFHIWVLAKIIIECFKLANEMEVDLEFSNQSKNITIENLNEFVERAEKKANIQEYEFLMDEISIQKTIHIIDSLKLLTNRKRTVLLLDDAALTLTPEYLIEFFDIFRSLKTQTISPKASVYPGTTEYGPRFHVGQDAEEVSAWLNVEDETYIEFMDSIIKKRFETTTIANEEIIKLLKYCSFGIPRAFIGLFRNFQQQKSTKSIQQRFNTVLDNQSELIRKEYLSLTLKLPQYHDIIDVGMIFFDNLIKDLVLVNKNNIQLDKKTHLGLLEDENYQKAIRMIKFLIEAGLIYEINSLSEGSEKKFKRYIPHYLFLINNKAFSVTTRGFNSKEILEYIKRKPDKRTVRRQVNSLISLQLFQKIKLNLPPCNKCGTIRLSEEQKFCHNCGNPLIGVSAYEKALELTIDKLPLTTWQIQKINDETNLKTIEDVIMLQSPVTELKKVKGFGNVKTKRIIDTITNIVDEFLA